jgi:hypothetical protein
MKRERAWERLEKQSKPACGLRALTPNRQSVVSFEKLCGFARFSPQPGTAPQHPETPRKLFAPKHLSVIYLPLKPKLRPRNILRVIIPGDFEEDKDKEGFLVLGSPLLTRAGES